MMNRFETYFDAFYAYFPTETLGQFENLGFVGKIYALSLELLGTCAHLESLSLTWYEAWKTPRCVL